MKFAYDIIKKPIITERSMMGTQNNKYTFEVAADAGKIEIKKAVEEIFGVKVMKVNTIKLPGKWKRMGVHVGKRPDIKKAVVTLTPDSKGIELFENMMKPLYGGRSPHYILKTSQSKLFSIPPPPLPANGGRAATARAVVSKSGGARLGSLPRSGVEIGFAAQIHKNREHVSRFLCKPLSGAPKGARRSAEYSIETVVSIEAARLLWGSHPDNNESRS